MSMNHQENTLSLSGHRSEECQIYSLEAADFGACLNIGDHRMSDLALALLDCRLTADGRNPSECVLVESERTIICPEHRSVVSSYDILDVLLELFDACHPKSLKFFQDKITLLSSQLAYLTRRTLSRHSEVREDFDKVLKQTSQLNLLLQDNLLIGNELLKQTGSVTSLSSSVKQLLVDFKESPVRKEIDLNQVAKEIMSLRLSSFDTESLASMYQTSLDAKRVFAINDRYLAEMIYCSLCRCLFVFFTSKALGIVTGAYFILTILIAVQSVLSQQMLLHVVVETVLNQFLLLSFFLIKSSSTKKRSETHSTTQTSQVSM